MKSEVDQKRIDEVFANQKKRALALRNEKLKERKLRLKKLQIWIEKNREAIQHAVNSDFSKPKSEVDVSEIFPALNELKHAIKHLRDWASPQKVDAPLTLLGTTSYVQYEPKGVCLILAPWNYPFNLTIGPLISALAAGNTAMLKPSELTPNTSALIETMVGELFPENEVAVFQGDAETAVALLAKPFDHVFFTGSPAVGKKVMAAAAEHLTSVTLELGGKSPVIIDETAKLQDAAEKIAWGKFLNNGQTCLAPDYLLIKKGLSDQFIPLLKTAVQLQFDHELKGFNESSDYARIVNEKHYQRLNDMIAEAVEGGATVEMGGKSDSESNFIPPTILSNVPDDSGLLNDEIFGPILPVVEYDTIDEAIDIINNKPKPLALYYFGRSNQNRDTILNNTSSGGACVNDCVLQFTHTNLPFGGVNNSGIGKSHGRYGFLSFSNEKGVLRQRVGLTPTKTVYPPYNNKVAKLIDAMIKYF
ncbi:aldehyde dehydrogenase family protein [Fulvivirga sp. RKSG066]|nr:aldehyde dehydrogenase family protein [Fulvivirga aurantia]